MRYHDLEGEGIPILFIHGLGCASSFDYPQVAVMKDLAGYRRILVDLLGSGFSDKPDGFDYTMSGHAEYLADFIASLSFDKVILFGHSMGGAVVLSLAARCPECLAGVIISEENLDAGGGFFSRQVAAYTEEDYVTVGHEKMVANSRREGNTQWAASMAVSLPRAIYRQSRSLVEGGTPDWRDTLYALTVPRTFIFGEQSLPDPEQERLAGQGIQIEIVPAAGHSMAWENPEGLAAAIRRGIDRVSADGERSG
ncbi:MAG TPA: alpha/beta hydrolase [Anaerolineaceae bacterium]|nr:alpha/beta hydrolase [Anaerolineaceae bacterium]HPN51024.1 alpha/beta hydrolase [Anaerolineaceae bacterium]